MKHIITLLTLVGVAALSSCTTYVDDDFGADATTTTTTRTESAYVPGGTVQQTRTTRVYD